MHIIQFGLTDTVIILEEQIKYLLSDVVGLGGDFFYFFYREVHTSIKLVMDHGKCFISFVST